MYNLDKKKYTTARDLKNAAAANEINSKLVISNYHNNTIAITITKPKPSSHFYEAIPKSCI